MCLLKIASGRSRVEERQLHLFIGPDDKYCSSRERHALAVQLIGIKHAKLDGQFALRIGNYWIGKGRFVVQISVRLYVFDPRVVRFGVVARERNHL